MLAWGPLLARGAVEVAERIRQHRAGRALGGGGSIEVPSSVREEGRGEE